MAHEKKAEVCSGIPLVGPENTLWWWLLESAKHLF